MPILARLKPSFLVLVATLSLTACNMTTGNHVVWSPDGSSMAVLAGDGLHLGDANGNLSKLLAANVEQLEWLSDSRHAVVVQKEKISSWSELEKRLSEQERATVRTEATVLKQQLMAVKKSINEIDSAATKDMKSVDADLVYLVSTDPEFKQKYDLEMAKAGNKNAAAQVSADVNVVELVALSPSAMTFVKELTFTRVPIANIRLSPDDKMLCVVTDSNRPHNYLVRSISLADGRDLSITSAASRYPDWSVNGRELLFFEEKTGEASTAGLHTGALLQRAICDESGHLLQQPGQPKKLADVAFTAEERVRQTKDGRVFFTSPTVQLPYTQAATQERLSIFALDPARYNSAIALSGCDDPSLLPQYFDVNNDGTYIAIPEQSGATRLLCVATGASEAVQPAATKGGLIVLPSFRSRTELTFAAPGDKKGKEEAAPKLLLWNIEAKAGKDLSATWPQKLKSQWLEQ